MMTTVGSVLIPTVPPPCFGLKLHLHFDRRCVCVDLHATVRVLFFFYYFFFVVEQRPLLSSRRVCHSGKPFKKTKIQR